jgi:hypothetical protein
MNQSHILFEDTELEEGPHTIAYILLALSSLAFDFNLTVVEDFGQEIISVRDNDTDHEYFGLVVSPVMGRLLVSVLEGATKELREEEDDEGEEWPDSNNS